MSCAAAPTVTSHSSFFLILILKGTLLACLQGHWVFSSPVLALWKEAVASRVFNHMSPEIEPSQSSVSGGKVSRHAGRRGAEPECCAVDSHFN